MKEILKVYVSKQLTHKSAAVLNGKVSDLICTLPNASVVRQEMVLGIHRQGIEEQRLLKG